jgi:hypothetical protein
VHVESFRQIAEHHVDHAAAVRPAVDIVAEKNQGSVFCALASRRIGHDLPEQQGKQIRPPVNVANGVDELAPRQGMMVQGEEPV